jgi:hypothetical protein
MICLTYAVRVSMIKITCRCEAQRNSGYVRSEGLGDLPSERPHASRRTIDQDLLPWLDLPLIAKSLEGGECGHPNGRGLLEREVGRLRREVVLSSTRIFREGTFAPAEYLITWLKLLHVLADRLDLPRDIVSRNKEHL